MTQLLDQALAELRSLSEAEQDAIAAVILAEIDDEKRWDESFARSQDQLARLAQRVRKDIASGKAHDQGIDEL
jgi:regulator of sirC expression with transglutaminase-like and TPR domain